MLPATKALPKEMLPVAGKPLIQYAVEEAAASGIETVVLVIRNYKSLIQAHFARDLGLESFLGDRQLTDAAQLVRRLTEIVDLRYVEQENALGLAHAISCARPLIEQEPFAVLLPDVIMVNDEPVTSQLIHAYQQHGGSVIAIRKIQHSEVERFGVIRVGYSSTFPTGESVRVNGLVEKPSAENAPSFLGVFGRYVLEPSIWEAIAQTEADGRGEVQLTDGLNLLCQKRPLFGLCFQGQHYDAGDRVGYLTANIELSLRDPRVRQPLLSHLSRMQARLADRNV